MISLLWSAVGILGAVVFAILAGVLLAACIAVVVIAPGGRRW